MATDTTCALVCAKACRDAQALIAQIKAGDALPDALHAALQAIRATGDGEQLRTFTRQIAKATEGSR
jgi:hypothetical protein